LSAGSTQGVEVRRPGRDNLCLVVVVPDEQTYANEGQQELENHDENVNHNG